MPACLTGLRSRFAAAFAKATASQGAKRLQSYCHSRIIFPEFPDFIQARLASGDPGAGQRGQTTDQLRLARVP